jgi:hypothetical protein
MKSFIKKLLRENIEYGYFKDKTTIPDFDALRKGLYHELPKNYQNLEAWVDFMTKDEYIRECAKLQGTSFNQQLSFINDNKVKEYVKAMSNGAKFNMGYLDYASGQQEGRHRIVAAAELGQTKIPVLIIDKKEVEGTDLDSKLGVWDDLQKNKQGDYLITYDLSKYENQNKLLKAFSKNYDDYLLDEILDEQIYRKSLYQTKYDDSSMSTMGNSINLNDFDIFDFPEEYLNTLKVEDGEYTLTPDQETYMKFIIKMSLDDKVKENNSYFLSYINFNDKFATISVDGDIKFEGVDEYDSAKDMLVSQSPYDLSFKTWREVDLDPKLVRNNIKKFPFK